VRDSILQRFDSDIRTDAQGTEDGGNITTVAGGLILVILSENSDIIVRASCFLTAMSEKSFKKVQSEQFCDRVLN